MNTLLDYMYRDGGNWKNGKNVIFSGEITPELKARFLAALEDGVNFIADQLSLPEAFLWNPEADYDPDDESTYPVGLGAGDYVINNDDHCWHEFCSFEGTNDVPTDPRTIEQFVCEVEKAAKVGWRIFDPSSRKITA